ncbi:hypothetical protein D3C72_2502820 [compost metagenome]
MQLVAGRFAQVGKSGGDLLDGGFIAPLGGKKGGDRLDCQAELIAALDIGDGLDR